MKNLVSFLFCILLLTVNQSSLCARPLEHAVDSSTDRSMITFFIDDVLSNKHSTSSSSSTVPVVTIGNGDPVGLLFKRNDGRRSSTTTNNYPHVAAATSARGHDAGGGTASTGVPVAGWLSFLTSLEALESGNLTVIDEELTGTTDDDDDDVALTGKVQGVYVTCSSEEDSHSHSHMVAMRAIFGGRGSVDSLRFFGEHRTGGRLSESHIAVVGGTGRYDGANGFVVVKEVVGLATKRKLDFTVYIN